VIATTAVGAAGGGLVRDGDTGLVIAANNPQRLAEAIDMLLGNESLRRRLGAAAKTAVQPFTYEAMAAGVEAALNTAAAGSWRRHKS
jgi:glycosyltransferase involved in cell wall biosynthesis